MIAFVTLQGGHPSVVLSQEDEEDLVEVPEESSEDEEEAPNPILPTGKELLWSGASFLVLLVLMRYFAFPAVRRGMDARSTKVRGDLTAAEDARAEAERVLVDYRAQLADARAEASRLVDEARAAIDAEKSERLVTLNAELADLRARSAAELEQSKARAVTDLRSAVADIALTAAERVLQRPLDRQAEMAVIEDYVNQASAGNGSGGTGSVA